MSHLNDNKGSGGIKINAPKEGEMHDPNQTQSQRDAAQNTGGGANEAEIIQLHRQLDEAQKRITDLTAFLYNILDQYETEFFEKCMVAKQIKGRIRMTPDMYEIIHRSREQAEQNSQ